MVNHEDSTTSMTSGAPSSVRGRISRATRFTRVLPAAAATAALITVTASGAPAWADGTQGAAKTGLFSTAWCPLGHNKGGGCRGGSLADKEAAKRATVDTLRLYKDAIECTIYSGEGAFDYDNGNGGNPPRNLRECSQERGYWG